MVNIVNFKKVLDYLEKHPKEWNQDYYLPKGERGGCFIGRAAIFHQMDDPSIVLGSFNSIEWYGRIYLDLNREEFLHIVHPHRTMNDFKHFLNAKIEQQLGQQQ